ncbi:MAG: hypothetical protein ACKOBV_10430 [Candidatus Kapaibacterium sp.]
MKTVITTLCVVCFFAVAFDACQETLGPNELGGSGVPDLCDVGKKYHGSVTVPGSYIPGFDHMTEEAVVTRNDNGNITISVNVTFDSVFVRALDSALGTGALPGSLRTAVISEYARRYGATLDTMNKASMKAHVDFKLKVTSEGIQEYVNARGDQSKPYTIVKYAAGVGDTYTYTNADGIAITRKVTYKSTTDDYPLAFWNIKVIKVEETKEDLLMEKVTYYANHKFGLVGVLLRTKTGKELKIGIFPPNLQ